MGVSAPYSRSCSHNSRIKLFLMFFISLPLSELFVNIIIVKRGGIEPPLWGGEAQGVAK
jgi:hypothetical protein